MGGKGIARRGIWEACKVDMALSGHVWPATGEEGEEGAVTSTFGPV